MARKITQETFNEVVAENINEFSMSQEEAVDDAVKQFEAQGVDLSNILKCVASDILPSDDTEGIEASIKNLEEFMHNKEFKQEMIDEFTYISQMCEKSMSHKAFIGKSEFLRVALDILNTHPQIKDLVAVVLKCLIALMTDFPDLLSSFGACMMSIYLEKEKHEECLTLLLTWIKVTCVKHEANRQCIVSSECVPRLTIILESYSNVPSVVKGVCSVFRALVLDDDIRVEFGHAHEHARMIAEGSLVTLGRLLKEYALDKDIVGELLLTLSSVIVRNEYCEKLLEDEGGSGLTCVLNVFVNYPDSEKLNRQCMKLLKTLAGNDRVKAKIIYANAAPMLVSSMNRHQPSSQLIAVGNGCIAALTLRNPTNSKAFCDAGAPAIILDGMRTHKEDLSVQKQGCWAIRNVVSRSRDLCPLFLELGAEDLLNFVLKTHKEHCEYDAKAALRDLGCHVDFREEWTGKGGALN